MSWHISDEIIDDGNYVVVILLQLFTEYGRLAMEESDYKPFQVSALQSIYCALVICWTKVWLGVSNVMITYVMYGNISDLVYCRSVGRSP